MDTVAPEIATLPVSFTVPVIVPVVGGVGTSAKSCVAVFPAVTVTLAGALVVWPLADAVSEYELGVRLVKLYAPAESVVVELPPEMDTVAPEMAAEVVESVTWPLMPPVVGPPPVQLGNENEPMRVRQLNWLTPDG
jgi:hypothetical protein